MANKTEKVPYIYCFLDTNILLEFETFDDVDWPKVLNAKQVCLVLAPVVLSELDKHKTDYNNVRRQKRARMLLPKITNLTERETIAGELPQVRRNVTLMVLPNEPLIDWAIEHLDPTVNDDRLIASTLEFSRQHPTETVLLLSDDSGPRFKAKPRSIQTLAPPYGLNRLVEPPSPEEVENRKLKQQIKELTERIPDLKFGFYEHGHIVNANEIMRPVNTTWLWQTPEKYAEEKVAQKREDLTSVLAKANDTVPEDEVQEFRETYEKYLAQLEPAFKMQFIKDYSPNCMVQFIMVNGGSAPANGVGLHIAFPKGSSVITLSNPDDTVEIETEVPDEPDLPAWAQPPVPEWVKKMLPSSSQLAAMSATSMLSKNILGSMIYRPAGFYKSTYYDYTFPFDHNTLVQKTDKLSHHEQWPFKPLVVYLPPDTLKGFSIKYSVYADELLKPITGELKVTWEDSPQDMMVSR